MKTDNQRLGNMDLLRIIAGVGVVMIHMVTAPVANALATVNAELKETLHIIHNLISFAVPVFFMITGYLIQQKTECTYNYCLRKVVKYIAVLFTVGLAYALMERFFDAHAFSVNMISAAFWDVINGKLWAHMWYVYAVIGIYLILPLTHEFFKKKNDAVWFIAILFVFSILVPYINGKTALNLNIYFPLKEYIFYVCFGQFCAGRTWNRKIAFPVCALAIIAASICIISRLEVTGYNDPIVCAMSCGIFVSLSMVDKKSTKCGRFISDCIFGIYLLHPLFLNVILKLLNVDIISSFAYLKIPLVAVAIFIISLITTFILKKIPIINKLF